MRRLAGLAAILAAPALLLLAAPATAAGLDALRWEKRPLLVFAPAAADERLASQIKWLGAHPDGLRDRRLAVYAIVGADVVATLGAPAPDVSATLLRSRFGVAPGEFRVVLVGLDGGAKLAEAAPVAAGRLFGMIDGMPMRREELRRR